jgi:hypothetical protein
MPNPSVASLDIATTVAELSNELGKLKISPSPAALTKPRSFLNLPAELRIMVYTYLSPYSGNLREKFDVTSYLNLIRTCKQIQQEAPPEIQRAAKLYEKK